MEQLPDQFGTIFPFSLLFVAFLIPNVLLGLAIPYGILKIRDGSAAEHDPELGIKATFHFVYSLAVLAILSALTVLVMDYFEVKKARPGPMRPVPGRPGQPFRMEPQMIEPEEGFTTVQRNATAVIAAGALFALLHLLMIVGFTNNRKFPDVRRAFLGGRLAVCSLVVGFLLTAIAVVAAQKEFSLEKEQSLQSLKQVLWALAVWGPAWMIHLAALHVARRKSPVTVAAPAA